ncbi:hypothetical protein PROFUN_06541, partial [Planoprotostelium fungivorum]
MSQALSSFDLFKSALTEPWDKIKRAKTEEKREKIIKEALPEATTTQIESILFDWESDTPLPTQGAA